MSEVLAVLNNLSMTVKVGWGVWLVWCLIQLAWYRYALRQAALPQAVQQAIRRNSSGGRRPIARRPDPDMWSSTSSVASSKYGSPELVTSLGLGDPQSSVADQTR